MNRKQVKLRKALDSKGITPYRLAKDCNIATANIYNLLNGKQPAYPRWKKVISEYLSISMEELFIKED